MGLSALLELGVDAAISKGRDDLGRHVANRGLPTALVDDAEAALRVLPELLSAFEARLWDESSPMAERALFPVVLTYAWRLDDLVPAKGQTLILGLLDDTYLALSVAVEAGILADRDLADHVEVLRKILPREVVEALDSKVEEALTSTIAQAEQRGG